MSAIYNWQDVEQSIYCIRLTGGWDWNAYHEAIEAAYQDITAKEYPVDVIVWFETGLPHGNALPHLQRLSVLYYANPRHTLFINNASTLIEATLWSVANHKNWEMPIFVKSMPDALDYLHAQRQAHHIA